MEQNISFKKEVEKILEQTKEIKGNVRGEILLDIFNYILEKKGKSGIKAVEEKLKEVDYPLKFEAIRFFEWYPNRSALLVMLVIGEIFHWDDSDFFKMGNSAPKYSLITKMLMKYLISVKRICREAPKYWRKHFDFGELELKVNEEQKNLIIKIKGHNFIPSVCAYNAGFFLRVIQFCVKSKKTTIEETKCMLRGDPHHEYIVKW